MDPVLRALFFRNFWTYDTRKNLQFRSMNFNGGKPPCWQFRLLYQSLMCTLMDIRVAGLRGWCRARAGNRWIYEVHLVTSFIGVTTRPVYR